MKKILFLTLLFAMSPIWAMETVLPEQMVNVNEIRSIQEEILQEQAAIMDRAYGAAGMYDELQPNQDLEHSPYTIASEGISVEAADCGEHYVDLSSNSNENVSIKEAMKTDNKDQILIAVEKLETKKNQRQPLWKTLTEKESFFSRVRSKIYPIESTTTSTSATVEPRIETWKDSRPTPKYHDLFNASSTYLACLKYKKDLKMHGIESKSGFQPFTLTSHPQEIQFQREEQFEQYVRAKRYGMYQLITQNSNFLENPTFLNGDVSPEENELHMHLTNYAAREGFALATALDGAIVSLRPAVEKERQKKIQEQRELEAIKKEEARYREQDELEKREQEAERLKKESAEHLQLEAENKRLEQEKADRDKKQKLADARTRFYKTVGIVGLATAGVAAVSYLVWNKRSDSSKNNDAREDEHVTPDSRERRVYQL